MTVYCEKDNRILSIVDDSEVDMEYILDRFVMLYIFSVIGVTNCTIQSGYWEKEKHRDWYNTTDGVVYTTTTRRLFDCVTTCLDNTQCLMFGYSNITGTCHGFRYLEDKSVSNLEESEVVYKYTQSCGRAGYVLLEDGPLCVKRYDAPLTWDDAQTQCEKDRGRLAVIDDVQKFEALVKYLESFPGAEVWLGINDVTIEGTWTWLNGASLNRTYWSGVVLNNYSTRYTSNKFSADCAWILDRNLNDDHCLLTFPYMCERPDLV
ncbi:uncharacterized protein LOC117317196 [Pecten maximus]|uniref:uncharacterized protein LOC117317196 n=1 Tax=Pecten maximus TaxID=6579 RepID=UPI001458A8AB|nr:uncharacterized protein LOC117317196 [Pecten maximus]